MAEDFSKYGTPVDDMPLVDAIWTPLAVLVLLIAAWWGILVLRRVRMASLLRKALLACGAVGRTRRRRELLAAAALGILLALIALRGATLSYDQCILNHAPASDIIMVAGTVMQSCRALYGDEGARWSPFAPGTAANLALIGWALIFPIIVCWLLRSHD